MKIDDGVRELLLHLKLVGWLFCFFWERGFASEHSFILPIFAAGGCVYIMSEGAGDQLKIPR